MQRLRKPNRSKIINIISSMATELEQRAAEPDEPSASELEAYRRTVKYLRELLSIAEGRRSAAYWTGQTA